MEALNKAHQEKEREIWQLYCHEKWTLKQAEKDGDKQQLCIRDKIETGFGSEMSRKK